MSKDILVTTQNQRSCKEEKKEIYGDLNHSIDILDNGKTKLISIKHTNDVYYGKTGRKYVSMESVCFSTSHRVRVRHENQITENKNKTKKKHTRQCKTDSFIALALET